MKKKFKDLFNSNNIINAINSSGKISYNWVQLAKYWLGGDLDLTLSGDIDQNTLDNDINTWAVVHTVHISANLWDMINNYGFKNDDEAKFTFIPVTNRIKTDMKAGTIIESTLLFIGNTNGNEDPATINITDGGTVEIKGQIIEALDHLTTLVANITNSTFQIDKAHIIEGTFNINPGGIYIFGGEAPDINAVIPFIKTDGSTEKYCVTLDEVTYNNGNSDKNTFYEQKLFNSTFNLSGGKIQTLNNGVIFLDYGNNITLKGICQISGNIIIGWNNNSFAVNSLFEINDNSNLIISGSIDLAGNGFTGNGTLIIMGEYYDSNGFHLSTFNLSNGGQIGTTYIGYDPKYSDGLGGYAGTFSNANLTNPDALYGAQADFSGSVKLNGNLYLGGGIDANKNVWEGTLTLADNTIINDAATSNELTITSYGVLNAGSSVSLGSLYLSGGQINLSVSDQFTTLKSDNGSLIATGNVSGNTLNIQGGNLTFKNDLGLTGDISITGGILTVDGTFTDQTNTISVTGSGGINFPNVGNLKEIDINTTGNNTLGNNVIKLVLQQGNSGQTILTGGSFGDIEADGGILTVSNDITNETGNNLTVAGANVTFNNLTINNNISVAAGNLTVKNTLKSDLISVTGTGSVDIGDVSQLSEIDINTTGNNTLGGNVVKLVLQQGNSGQTILTGGSFGDIEADGGILTVSNDITNETGNNLTVAGANVTFNNLTINNNISVAAGNLTVKNTLKSDLISVTGTGSVDIGDVSQLSEIDINTTGNNTLGGNVVKLVLQQGNSGKTTLLGNSFDTITIYSGELIASDNEIGNYFTLNNVSVTFNKITINKSIILNSGKMVAQTLNNNTGNTLIIGENTSVDITGGNLGNISINGSKFDNYLGGTINDLTINNGSGHLVYLKDSVVIGIDLENVSDLVILNNTSVSGPLTLKTGTTLDIKGILNYSGVGLTVQDQANLTLDGGTLEISSGQNVIINGNINFNVNNNGIIELDNKSSLDFTNGMTLNGQLELKGDSGSVTFNGKITSGNNSTITIDSGVTLVLNPGCNIQPLIVLNEGSILDIKDPTNTNVALQLNDTTVGNILIKFDGKITSDQCVINSKLNDFSKNVELDFTPLDFNKVNINKVFYQDGKIYIEYSDKDSSNVNKEIILNNVNVDNTISNGQEFEYFNDGSGGIIFEACFLAKSQIATPFGLVNVEKIKINDEILTFNHNKEQKDKIIWAGKSSCYVRPDLPDDLAGYPICITKGAIKENIPSNDLLVTAEHCLFLNNQFIPARMLVNNRSIYYDKTISNYEYFHIETKNHSVIMANGLLTESYLDTGNRKKFYSQTQFEHTDTQPIKTWEYHAAAPLTVRKEIVEPLFKQIDARAIQLGLKNYADIKTITLDPNIYLLADNHHIIHKTHIENQKYYFIIPSGVKSIEIISHANRPCDSIGPYIDDRRYLGVLVGEVVYRDASQTKTVNSHLKTQKLNGWNELELHTSNCRWTNGKAILHLKERNLNTTGQLSVQILSSGPYLLNNDNTESSMIKSA